VDQAAAAGPTAQTAVPPGSQAPRPDNDADDTLIASIEKGAYDPLEPVNRSFFALNRGIDYVLLDPVTRAYEFIVPLEGRRAVRRVFRNLSAPRTLANDILQLKFRDALVTTARFAINSTLGMAGLFDPAANFGLQRHEADFGETLARAGIGAGPYLVLPLLGPTTFRDGIGSAVDGFMVPQFWLLGHGSQLLLGSGDGLSLRDEHIGDLRHLKESSVDYYAALRSAYLLDREGEIRERLEDAPSVEPASVSPQPETAPPAPAVPPAAAPKASDAGEVEPGTLGAQAAALLKSDP
jgi:phospholipid-binding lipoprotein MlaA